MSVMGSQLEIDMDPDGDLTVVPRHTGQTGTGCYRLHDHQIYDPSHNRLGPVYANLPGDAGGDQGEHTAPEAFFLESSLQQQQPLPAKAAPATGNGDAAWSGSGPGPPPYGLSPQQQQHLLDMPLQPPTPTAIARQRGLKQLTAPGQKPMVRDLHDKTLTHIRKGRHIFLFICMYCKQYSLMEE